MIEQIDGRPDGILEFRISGHVTGGDYGKVLVPAIEMAFEAHDRIRILAQIGPKFEGYSLEAAWDDAKLGLRHWSGFERAAIVSDVDWIKTMVRALGFVMPCPIKVFDLDELEDARYWLSEALGSISIKEVGDGVLRVELAGNLDIAAYAGVNDELDAIIATNGRIKLLLDLREFDGWQGLSGLAEHFSLVRDHRHAPTRVAVVGNQEWQKMAERVFSKFVDADVKFFESPAADGAETWIRQD